MLNENNRSFSRKSKSSNQDYLFLNKIFKVKLGFPKILNFFIGFICLYLLINLCLLIFLSPKPKEEKQNSYTENIETEELYNIQDLTIVGELKNTNLPLDQNVESKKIDQPQRLSLLDYSQNFNNKLVSFDEKNKNQEILQEIENSVFKNRTLVDVQPVWNSTNSILTYQLSMQFNNLNSQSDQLDLQLLIDRLNLVFGFQVIKIDYTKSKEICKNHIPDIINSSKENFKKDFGYDIKNINTRVLLNCQEKPDYTQNTVVNVSLTQKLVTSLEITIFY